MFFAVFFTPNTSAGPTPAGAAAAAAGAAVDIR